MGLPPWKPELGPYPTYPARVENTIVRSLNVRILPIPPASALVSPASRKSRHWLDIFHVFNYWCRQVTMIKDTLCLRVELQSS